MHFIAEEVAPGVTDFEFRTRTTTSDTYWVFFFKIAEETRGRIMDRTARSESST
jgi:hypothetical protein